MNSRQRTAVRLLLSIVVGILVSGMAIRAAWLNSRHSLAFAYSQFETKAQMKRIDEAISEYRQKNGHLPQMLDQLPDTPNSRIKNNYGELRDAWRRPFIFSRSGRDYMLMSYGRDGKSGGVGLNYDFSNRVQKLPPDADMPFQQLYSLPGAKPMLLWCLFSGILTAALVFIGMENQDFSRRSCLILVFAIPVTIVFALFVTVFLAFLHVPLGH